MSRPANAAWDNLNEVASRLCLATAAVRGLGADDSETEALCDHLDGITVLLETVIAFVGPAASVETHAEETAAPGACQ